MYGSSCLWRNTNERRNISLGLYIYFWMWPTLCDQRSVTFSNLRALLSVVLLILLFPKVCITSLYRGMSYYFLWFFNEAENNNSLVAHVPIRTEACICFFFLFSSLPFSYLFPSLFFNLFSFLLSLLCWDECLIVSPRQVSNSWTQVYLLASVSRAAEAVDTHHDAWLCFLFLFFF